MGCATERRDIVKRRNCLRKSTAFETQTNSAINSLKNTAVLFIWASGPEHQEVLRAKQIVVHFIKCFSFKLKDILKNSKSPVRTSPHVFQSTWLHRYYLNWTKLDNAITKFNNEMHSADNWVLNPVILHYWHNLPILILCSALLQFVLLKALYK